MASETSSQPEALLLALLFQSSMVVASPCLICLARAVVPSTMKQVAGNVFFAADVNQNYLARVARPLLFLATSPSPSIMSLVRPSCS